MVNIRAGIGWEPAQLSAIAGRQVLLLDREDLRGFHLDVMYNADPPFDIRQLDVVAAGLHAGDVEPLVGIDRAVLVVLALVAAPIGGAGGSEIEFGDGLAGQIPEPWRPALGERGRRSGGKRQNQE